MNPDGHHVRHSKRDSIVDKVNHKIEQLFIFRLVIISHREGHIGHARGWGEGRHLCVSDKVITNITINLKLKEYSNLFYLWNVVSNHQKICIFEFLALWFIFFLKYHLDYWELLVWHNITIYIYFIRGDNKSWKITPHQNWSSS